MEGTQLPHVNYEELQVGETYAIRGESGMTLEQGLYLGRCPHRLQDGRVVRGRAWAIASEGGWWRPDWSWALQRAYL
jgi:hypothetical protein